MLSLSLILADVAGVVSMTTLGVVCCLTVYLLGFKKEAFKIMATGIVATCITYTIKLICKVPRPLDARVIEDTYRFPSGHATMAAVVASLCIYYAMRYIKSSYMRSVIYILSLGWFLLVSWSRLYLGVHVFIDVFVGGLIGVASTVFVVHVFKHIRYYR
jgi:undecaprenyl-diphosphatase